mgnify:CR=1 FL=1
MAAVKKVLITLPESLLHEVDSLASMDNITRSECVREAMRYYLAERKKAEIRESLIRGYQEMAALNLVVAEEFTAADQEVWPRY